MAVPYTHVHASKLVGGPFDLDGLRTELVAPPHYRVLRADAPWVWAEQHSRELTCRRPS
ncbi:MAG TPA: hypothetical protein VK066_02430 [Chloroflexota bacterium]|nr:hypothetical protein [Chloroflexota bacterium]